MMLRSLLAVAAAGLLASCSAGATTADDDVAAPHLAGALTIEAKALATRIESGNACVNECVISAGVQALPFGGVKQSGVGWRHGGAEGLRQFCVRQAQLVEPRARPKGSPRFPYSSRQAQQLERLIGVLFGWR